MNDDDICLKYDLYIGDIYTDIEIDEIKIVMIDTIESNNQIPPTLLEKYKSYIIRKKIKEYCSRPGEYKDKQLLQKMKNALMYGKTLQFIKINNNIKENEALISEVKKILVL